MRFAIRSAWGCFVDSKGHDDTPPVPEAYLWTAKVINPNGYIDRQEHTFWVVDVNSLEDLMGMLDRVQETINPEVHTDYQIPFIIHNRLKTNEFDPTGIDGEIWLYDSFIE